MKYLIASDIHGSAYWCRKLLETFDALHAARLVLLGDLLYHGPRNDLPDEYAPKEVARLLNERRSVIMAIRGNCDAEVDQMVLEFPIMAECGMLEVAAASSQTAEPDATVPSQAVQPDSPLTLYLTHGHHYSIDNPLPIPAGSILLYGHTHIPLDEVRGGIRFINPGSVSIPKAGSVHSCLLLEDGAFSFIDLSHATS